MARLRSFQGSDLPNRPTSLANHMKSGCERSLAECFRAQKCASADRTRREGEGVGDRSVDARPPSSSSPSRMASAIRCAAAGDAMSILSARVWPGAREASSTWHTTP